MTYAQAAAKHWPDRVWIYGKDAFERLSQSIRIFDLPYVPVLKAVCGRNIDRAESFAQTGGTSLLKLTGEHWLKEWISIL